MHPRPAREFHDSKKPFDTCEQEVEFIGRYLSFDLQAHELSAFENHLAICPDCVAFLKTYRATVELTRNYLTIMQSNATSGLSLLPARARSKRR
jgi:hypothetical protein